MKKFKAEGGQPTADPSVNKTSADSPSDSPANQDNSIQLPSPYLPPEILEQIINFVPADHRLVIPAGEKFFFSPPFLDRWREITRLVCSPPPLPLPPPIEKTLSFPPLFTAIHKWMPLCLKAWLSLSNKKAASAGNRTRAARALLQ